MRVAVRHAHIFQSSEPLSGGRGRVLPHLSWRGISGSPHLYREAVHSVPHHIGVRVYVFPSVVRSSLGVRCALCSAYRCEGGVSMLGVARDSAVV